MSVYLLDTNILTELARNPFGPSARNLNRVGSQNVFTSIIVAAEVQFGIDRFNAFKLLRQMERIMETIEIQTLPEYSVATYSALRIELERKGTPISANDMWIAAHAIAENAVLVTNNIREFSRIANLKVENWMQKA